MSWTPIKRAACSWLGVLLLAHASCTTTAWRGRLATPEQSARLDPERDPYLKVHFADGRLCVLEAWNLEPEARLIRGRGVMYDAERVAPKGPVQPWSFRYDEVALLETNRPESVVHSGLIVMGVVAGLSLAVTAACIASPKTCFGSCPTFYAPEAGAMTLQAEGFSASIARALEASDVDPLYTTDHHGGELVLRVTNEALETHVIRSVDVLSAPRPAGGRVVHDGDAFFEVQGFEPPVRCASSLGDCSELLRAVDDRAYLSLTDGDDLGSKETVELTFAAADAKAPKGIVIVGRMGLVTTFLLYQALAYLGHDAGQALVSLERGGSTVTDMARGFHALLGEVEVEAELADGTWAAAGAFYEMGPIAREAQLIRLPENLAPGDVHVRLRMTRGHFKLDQVALVGVGAEVRPEVHPVHAVLRDGRPDPGALAQLSDPAQALVTYPGDAYELRFALPEGERELFLRSRGYYYEWMRDSWLREQNRDELASWVLDPAAALRKLAPAYKHIEPEIERLFWQSRIGARP